MSWENGTNWKLGVCLALVGCGNSSAPQIPSGQLHAPKPWVIADQGDCQFAPENTMVAVRNGYRHGADIIEVDVNITSDGELVLLHDGSLDRTTNCTGNVDEETLAEVRACDAAFWWVPGGDPGLVADPSRDPNDGRDYAMRGKGVQIPTLREFFAFAVDKQLPMIAVEIKNIPYDSNFDPEGARMAEILVPLIEEYGLARRIIVESFGPTSLERVKQLNPEITTSFLTLGSANENYNYVEQSDTDHSSSDILAPDFDQDYVDRVHAIGRLALPWLVDEPDELELVKSYGVDGLYTCHTTCMLQALGRPAPLPVITPEAGVAYDVPACP